MKNTKILQKIYRLSAIVALVVTVIILSVLYFVKGYLFQYDNPMNEADIIGNGICSFALLFIFFSSFLRIGDKFVERLIKETSRHDQ